MVNNEGTQMKSTYREFRISIMPEPTKLSQPQMKYIAVAKLRCGKHHNLQETFTAHGIDAGSAKSLVKAQVDAYWKQQKNEECHLYMY